MNDYNVELGAAAVQLAGKTYGKVQRFKAGESHGPGQKIFPKKARDLVAASSQAFGGIVDHVRNAAFALFWAGCGDQDPHLSFSPLFSN
jgi:hypothetical protein